MFDALLIENHNFELFGLQHLLTVLLSAVLGWGLIYYARNYATLPQQLWIQHLLGCWISFVVILWTFLEWYTDNFDYKEDLPLLICNLMGLLLPIYTYRPKQKLFEIAYFWILGWTFLAIVTPDLDNGFPQYNYWKFFTVHIGLVCIVFYSIFVLGYRPYVRSIGRSYLGMFVYIVFILIVNFFLKANYFYINHKPENPTAIDIFGDWPYYIFWILLILPFYFVLLYVPYWIMDKRKENQSL